MSDLPKAYDHTLYEHTWYALWEKASLFKSNPTSKKTFSIVIPPPNVTGVLHMGHALVNSLQDILIRHQRMQGVDAVWVPGTDHAGIATQMVLENFLKKTEGISRKDLSREAFIQRGWQWTQEHEAKIFAQLKQLGCSCDWSRKRFTMDESCTRAVRRCFKLLFDANIIYKGSYLVNWDPVMQTALADDEVEHESKEGFLWYFKYPIKGSSQHITIATTRPETMLGDTALAIHPEDLKHRHLLHQTAIVPLIGREIPIIADHRIDPSFGSGVIKVTPAHDPTDYQIGLDHQLECINIFTPTAHINEVGVSFKGMSREEARQAVVAAMQAQGLLDKVEPHTHMVGVSYRSKAIIEPMLSKQWFVSMKPFMETLKQAPTLIEFLPPHILNSYHHWIDHLKDWCISRQLWWGHRIPVWYHTSGRMIVSEEDVPEQVQQDPTQWHQDEDVLDTWFSSALWPLSSFGWPDMDQEARFYPTSVLITGCLLYTSDAADEL